MKTIFAEPGSSTRSNAPPVVQNSHLWGIGIAVVFAAILCLWHSFDHCLPAPDDASYLLGSYTYADLLQHPKFWKADWWQSMLTVNRVYPPTVMLFNGVLRLIFGAGSWVNILSVACFGVILSATVYGTARLLTGKQRPAVLAAVLVNLYPQTSFMFHGFALDAPLMSMISCGLFALVWWRSAPSWRRALICGLVLGFSCLTKQIAVAYLIGPGLFFLAEGIRSDVRCRRFQLSGQLLVTAIVTVLIGLPWLLTNIPHIRMLAQDNEANMGALSLWQVFPRDINWYARSLPSVMSPLLFIAFILSLFIVDRNTHKRLLPVTLSAVGGVVLISTLTWIFPSLRFIAPAMIATAIYTGCAMSRLADAKVSAIAVWALLTLGITQFVSFNFAPYPISKPAFITQISESLGVILVEKIGMTAADKRELRVTHAKPQAEADWGQAWALSTIDKIEGRKAVYLNILPDYVQLNGNTFELLARTMGSPVKPTTSRRWTVMGDRVSFDSKTAMYFQWYLLKTGKQGNILRDEESRRNYAKIIEFVQSSGKFVLVDTHPLPDGSIMSLYRQK